MRIKKHFAPKKLGYVDSLIFGEIIYRKVFLVLFPYANTSYNIHNLSSNLINLEKFKTHKKTHTLIYFDIFLTLENI